MGATLHERAERARLKAQIAADEYRAEAIKRMAAKGSWRAAEPKVSASLASFKANANRVRPGPRPVGGSADSHRDQWTRDAIRRECQDLYRNNPIVQAFVDRKVDLLLGDGPRVFARTESDEWNREATSLLREWIDGPVSVCGRCSLTTMLGQAIGAAHTDGRSLLLLSDAGLQLIEDERVVNPVRHNTEQFVNGAERDAAGRIVRYHVSDWMFDGSSRTLTTRAIDARFVLDLSAPGVHAPNLTAPEPLLWSIRDIAALCDDTIESVAIAFRIATLFAAIETGPNPAAALTQFTGTDFTTGDYTTTTASDDPNEFELQPGMYRFLPTGGQITQLRPEHPSQQAETWNWHIISIMAARLGMALDTTHYQYDSSWSASRARLSMQWRAASSWRRWINQTVARVARWRLARAVVAGELPTPPTPDAHRMIDVRLAVIPQLDPEIETRSTLNRIDGMLVSREEALAEMGRGEFGPLVQRIAEEQRIMREAGVTPPPRQGAAAPQQAE